MKKCFVCLSIGAGTLYIKSDSWFSLVSSDRVCPRSVQRLMLFIANELGLQIQEHHLCDSLLGVGIIKAVRVSCSRFYMFPVEDCTGLL